jgi:hypothetical protein
MTTNMCDEELLIKRRIASDTIQNLKKRRYTTV